MRRIGVHTSIAGGIHKAILRAKSLGCTTLQIFSHNPRSWAMPQIPATLLREFKRLRHQYDMNPLFVHASYLVNIASINKAVRDLSLKMLQWELDIADMLEADYLVLHSGSCSANPEAGKRLVIDGLRFIAKAGRWRAKLILENTAGKRGDVASLIEDLAELYHSSREISAGICIDTCHAFQAGYDLRRKEAIEQFADMINKKIGPGCVKLIHLNDSKKGLSSGIDRHEHIGTGQIGLSGFKAFLGHPAFRDVPIILETPKKTELDDRRNLKKVRGILADLVDQ